MEGTGLTHGILGILGWIPGPVGAVANLVDAGVYCFVDHDYGMAALSLASSVAMGAGSVVKWAGSGAAKASLGAAKAAKVARSAEYVRTAAAFVTNAAIFAGGGISLWQNSDKLYQKYKAGELKLDWETAAEAGAAVFSAAACVVSGAGMVKEAKNLGKMMKEDNVVGRLKESVGRFGNGSKQLLRSGGGNEAHDLIQYDKLKEYYRQAEKYGTGSIKELDDGRIRFYEKLKPASKPGEMAGARHIREWNPKTGAKRDWYETLDHYGNIRQVRPDPYLTDGIKVHYMFDAIGRYIGKWFPE